MILSLTTGDVVIVRSNFQIGQIELFQLQVKFNIG